MSTLPCILSVRTDNPLDYSTIYPKVNYSTIKGDIYGQLYGPYKLTILATDWNSENEFEWFPEEKLLETDIIEISLDYSAINSVGEQFKEKFKIYDTGFLKGRIIFKCSSKPSVDFPIKYWWTR